MTGRTLALLFLVTTFVCATALAQPASSEDGAFSVGPYRAIFFATRDSVDARPERFTRQIPSFGPTLLNLEIVGSNDAASNVRLEQLEIQVRLFWGKNELKPPELLETRQSDGAATISFEHSFDEDGKYILAVTAREPGGAEHRGQYIFFVIQTADPQLLVSGLAAAIIVSLIYLVWRQRRRPPPRLAPRR